MRATTPIGMSCCVRNAITIETQVSAVHTAQMHFRSSQTEPFETIVKNCDGEICVKYNIAAGIDIYKTHPIKKIRIFFKLCHSCILVYQNCC